MCDDKKVENKSKKQVMQVLKYALFASSAGVIQIVSDTIMVECLHFYAWLSYLIALVLSVLWNFTFNRKFTFHSSSNVTIAMIKVFAFYLVFTPLSTLWTKLLVDNLGWNNYLVLALTMIINFISEFLYQKFFVFKEREKYEC